MLGCWMCPERFARQDGLRLWWRILLVLPFLRELKRKVCLRFSPPPRTRKNTGFVKVWEKMTLSNNRWCTVPGLSLLPGALALLVRGMHALGSPARPLAPGAWFWAWASLKNCFEEPLPSCLVWALGCESGISAVDFVCDLWGLAKPCCCCPASPRETAALPP